MIPWHRLFGLALRDLFTNSPWMVELERDLSLKKQLLDVVILRKRPGTFVGRLPDGLDNLSDHNLLSYRSLHDALDDWVLKELTSYYVNYRKQVSERGDLLPESAFRLYGISTRYPEKLAREVQLASVSDGVYEVVRGTDRITVIVLNEIPREEHNSLWLLFSGVPETVRFGAGHYRQRTPDMSTIFKELYLSYDLEGVSMPYTIEDFRRDAAREMMERLSPVERQELVKRFSPEERLRGLSEEAIEAYLKKIHEQPKKRQAARRKRGGNGRSPKAKS
jgi:hypothetical protein